MTILPFKQVDVFTVLPFKGNPLAVVFDADNLESAQLQAIATWTNLSETIFVLKPKTPKADYRVRIFTPDGEIPFAGHPTIGVCHAIREKYNITKPKMIQECDAGLVNLEINEAEEIFFTLPYSKNLKISDTHLAGIYASLGINATEEIKATPQLFDVGPKWLVIQLSTPERVLVITPDQTKLKEVSLKAGITGVCCFGSSSSGRYYETRTFAPAIGVNEDPVCGSGAGAVGAFLRQTADGFTGSFDLNQGQKVARDGKIRVIVTRHELKVGGNATTVIEGRISV